MLVEEKPATAQNQRPLLARSAVNIHLDARDKHPTTAKWTDAVYTTDPTTGHAKLDTPAGADT